MAPNSPPHTILSLWFAYQTGHMPRLAPKTRAAYRSAMRRLLPMLCGRPSGSEVAAWLDAERSRVADVHANYGLRVLQSVVRRAVELTGEGTELLTAVMAVKAQPTMPRPARCPAPDFFSRVMPAALNRGERAWLRLISFGPRKGEMLGLEPRDIVPSTRTAVDKDGNTYSYVVGEITIQRQRGRPHRKNRQNHLVVVDAETLADLQWTIANRETVKPQWGSFQGRSDGCVFPWGETYLATFMRRIRAELGADVDRYLPAGTAWHMFRHRMAKDAKERGESELQIADRLGDKSADMARRYSNDGIMRNELPAPPPPPVVATKPAARPTDDVIGGNFRAPSLRVALAFLAQTAWRKLNRRTVRSDA